jgi:hypothetical protein
VIDEDVRHTLSAGLAEPVPPAALKTTVMARIARETGRPSPSAPEVVAGPRRWRDLPAWLWLMAGIAAVAGVGFYERIQAALSQEWEGVSVPLATRLPMPEDRATAVVLALGLLVYLAGLLAPLRRRPLR